MISWKTPKRSAPLPHGRRRGGGRAFVLLEVIVSLAIMGFAVTTLLRSFTQSLNAAKRLEVQTQAQFFAQQLLHEFEIFPPDEGNSEGGFGDDYRNFSYRANVRYAEPDYNKLEGSDEVEQYFTMRELAIEIVYTDGKGSPWVAFKLDSALTGFEKFTADSKRSYDLY